MAAQGNTTQVGLGWTDHQKPRQRALAALRDGDLCARCQLRGIEHPMFRSLVTRRPSGLYVAPMLDLDDFPGRSYGGPQTKRLSYRTCNRRAGQRRGVQMRKQRRRVLAYTRW
jgi:hypothetical protein